MPDDPNADVQRRFDALVSGLDLDDLRALAQVLPIRRERLPRPELRRPPLRDRRVFRVRVDLDDSDPVIWRRLELRSDLHLNVVHQAIQSAFGWWDYHLNRFTLGGAPWDQHSQVFACKEDIDEADLEDEAILDSLVRFDETLQQAYFVLVEIGIHPNLVEIVNRLRSTEFGDDLTARELAVGTSRAKPTIDQITAALRPHQWFLDRAAGEGIVLTAAGYLKPADVEVVAPLVPAVAEWIGKNNREAHTYPLQDFRESLRHLGLLRKVKGRLLITKVGRAAQGDPHRLWQHLADRLRALGDSEDAFVRQANLLVLLYAATVDGAELPLDRVAQAMREFGWATSRGPLTGRDLSHLEALDLLRNVSDRPVDFRCRDRISTPAAALARAALTTG